MSNNKNKILTELPKTGKNRNDYRAMVGMTLELLYKDGFVYTVKVLDYLKGDNPYFMLEFDGQVAEICCGSFMAGHWGGLLKKITRDFKYSIGERIIDYERDLIVIEREYRQRIHAKNKKSIINDKWYKYKCNKCGDEDWIVETSLKSGTNCPTCLNKKAVLGINTIYDTHKWLIEDFGLDEQFAKTHTYGTNKKGFFLCKYCKNKKKNIPLSVIKLKSIGCACGDGFSYGHKYMYSVLKQNNIDFEDNVTFNWCKFKDYKTDKIKKGEYDFVIKNTKMIIEVDGSFHRKDNEMNGQTKEESKYIDDMKDKLAKEHGYEVIRICYNDDFKMKDNLLKSDIVNIINLNNVDWEECERFALSNRVIEICEYWNNKKENETTSDLELVFKINRSTIIDYLKKGNELGWCNYDEKEELEKGRRKGSSKAGKTCGKKVVMYDLENSFIMEAYSIHELVRKVFKEMDLKLGVGNISAVCNGKHKTHKGYIFKYID